MDDAPKAPSVVSDGKDDSDEPGGDSAEDEEEEEAWCGKAEREAEEAAEAAEEEGKPDMEASKWDSSRRASCSWSPLGSGSADWMIGSTRRLPRAAADDVDDDDEADAL